MRIGLIVNMLDEAYQISVYTGIVKRVAELGIELVCIQQENSFINADDLVSRFPKKEYLDLDGIILLTSVFNDNYVFVKKEDLEKVWGNIPIVSVGQKIKDVPSVLIQTDESMKELVEHLVLKHNYRRFMFIGGAKNNPDAIVREKIFIKAMEAYKPWFPDLSYVIKGGWFTEGAAMSAMTEYLLENKNEIPDVVVCANDNMAIGVYKFLKMNRNNPAIHECAVTGFDDIPQARFEIPSLTTVHQPLHEIGITSVNILKSMIEGENVRKEYYIESKVMYRRSCGCTSAVDDFESNEALFREMQANYVQSENLLRMVSHMGQDLNYGQSLGSVKWVVRQNMDQLNIKDFCILRFSNVDKKIVSKNLKTVLVDPIFIRRSGQEIYAFDKDTKIPLGQFFRKYMDLDENNKPNMIYKYLRSGEDLIGCVFYDASESVLPYLSSITVSIAQAMNRIKVMEEKKKHSDYLESEVSKRTKELVEANSKRMEVEAEVLKISEIERQRFSNDLHDDICQRLAGISMLCRSYSNSNKPVEKNEMIELAQLIGETLQVTREYAHNSYPVELEGLGLKYSLSNLCNTFETSSKIKCTYNWEVDDEIELDKTQKLNIFRIIQEALHNVSKHAKAQNVEVCVLTEKNNLIVKVIDDGCGFKKSSKEITKGIGLNSMQYRANQIDAVFSIKPNKPNGTIVSVSIKV